MERQPRVTGMWEESPRAAVRVVAYGWALDAGTGRLMPTGGASGAWVRQANGRYQPDLTPAPGAVRARMQRLGVRVISYGAS
jgi:hypothetical protein